MKKLISRRQFLAAAGVLAAVLPQALQVLQPVPLPVLPLPAAPSRWA